MTTVRPGMAIGHYKNSGGRAGTIGAIVRRTDASDDGRYILTCSHVLAPYDVGPSVGDAVVNAANKKVGTLLAHTLDRTGDNYVYGADAALAVIDRNNVDIKLDIKNVGPITGTGRFRGVSLKVYQKGFNDSKLRRATITDQLTPGSSIPFNIGPSEKKFKEYNLRDVVQVKADKGKFGDAGDSGAMVLNRFGHALGLLTFRITETKRRYFAPIELVLRELERAAGFSEKSLELVTEPGTVDLEQVYKRGGA